MRNAFRNGQDQLLPRPEACSAKRIGSSMIHPGTGS